MTTSLKLNQLKSNAKNNQKHESFDANSYGFINKVTGIELSRGKATRLTKFNDPLMRKELNSKEK